MKKMHEKCKLTNNCTYIASIIQLSDKHFVCFSSTVIVASLRFGPTLQQCFSLTLRKNVISNGIATPFHQVLSWLCQRKDYFTAASVALNLLNDVEAVRDLRGCPHSLEDENQRSYLEGLLDGIIPLDGNDFSRNDSGVMVGKGGTNRFLEDDLSIMHGGVRDRTPQTPCPITSLADMAVGCLIRGGSDMSKTLEGFLSRNIYYDASRASLMLVATTANAISDQNEMDRLSRPDLAPENSMFRCENPMENILWPIRCLFKITTTRECMSTALLLLNATIPNELRCQESYGDYGVSRPSLDLCMSIVSMVIASSASAAGYLLNLTDDDTNKKYWQSLDHCTQLAVSMISIQGKYPLLREAEVRSWALELISGEVFATIATSEEAPPTLSYEWLEKVCSACLSNAGCDVEKLLSPKPSISDLNEIMNTEDDGILLYQGQIEYIKCALAPSPRSGGLDFDIIIPTLLLLEKKSVRWNNRSSLPTQSLLNVVCDLAGRQTVEEPFFAFAGGAVMKQCACAENVLAAANLIGGEDGLVLHCADVLIKCLGFSMKQAESVLLKKGIFIEDTAGDSTDSIEETASSFKLTAGHRYLLWILEKYVLSVKKFGQFRPLHIRGAVDPVFTARVCLRAWLCLAQGNNITSSTWLVSWFRKKLDICDEGSKSKKRLACAALCRALLWPDDADLEDWNNNEGIQQSVLAETLRFDCKFLVDLAQACCGLIEAIPAPAAEEVLNKGCDANEVAFSGKKIQV